MIIRWLVFFCGCFSHRIRVKSWETQSFVISLNQEKEIGDAIIITITAPLTLIKIAIKGNSVAKLRKKYDNQNYLAPNIYLDIDIILYMVIIGGYSQIST